MATPDTKKPSGLEKKSKTKKSIAEVEGGKRVRWTPRPSFQFGKVLRVELEARFQADVNRSYDGADLAAGLDPFELTRRRVGLQGRLFEHVQFEVEREFATKALTPAELADGLTPKTPWKDVYIDVDYVKAVQVQLGRFKVPFGLDELTSVTHNDFVFRSLGADYLSPSRDVGMMAHGRFFKRGLSYRIGAFLHDGDNARSKKIQGGGRTVAGRLSGTPLRRVLPQWLGTVEFGVSAASTDLANESFRPNGLRGRTVLTQDTFFHSVYVNGRRQRWEGDAEWLAGPASVRAEYTHVTDTRIGQGLDGQTLPDVRYRSWYASGTWLLTGETKTRPVEPRRPLFRGGIGAVEIAVRMERIGYDGIGGIETPTTSPRAETIRPSGDRLLTLGVNWYLNRWVAIQLNGIRERVEDPTASPVPNGAAFWSRVLRVQFVL